MSYDAIMGLAFRPGHGGSVSFSIPSFFKSASTERKNAKLVFRKLSYQRQKELVHHIKSAKTDETHTKNRESVGNVLRALTLNWTQLAYQDFELFSLLMRQQKGINLFISRRGGTT